MFEIIYVPMENNLKADPLFKLCGSRKACFNRTLIQETLIIPNIEVGEVNSIDVTLTGGWMISIFHYL